MGMAKEKGGTGGGWQCTERRRRAKPRGHGGVEGGGKGPGWLRWPAPAVWASSVSP